MRSDANIFLKTSSKANDSFWIANRTEEDMGQFSADLFNKAAPSFRTRLRQYVKAGVGHFDHLL